MARDIESFKAKCALELEQSKLRLGNDLQTRFFEFQTKFSSYHLKQTEVIGELYGLLNEAEWAVLSLVHPMQPVTNKPILERLRETDAKCVELSRFFSKHRIYLDRGICEKVGKIVEALREAMIKFDTSHRSLSGVPDVDMWFEAWKVIEQQLPPLRDALEVQFRETFLVPNESKSSQVDAAAAEGT